MKVVLVEKRCLKKEFLNLCSTKAKFANCIYFRADIRELNEVNDDRSADKRRIK